MPPSERNAPAQAEQDDDILDRTPSHPVTTTLLIVSALALMIAIGVTTTELERYVNQDTRRDLDNFMKSPVVLFEETHGVSGGGAEEEGAGTPRRRRPSGEEQPAEQPAAPIGEPAAPAGEPATPAEQPAAPAAEPAAPAPAPAPAPAEGSAGEGGGS